MIELREVRAGYGGREVLHGVSMAFAPGRVHVVLGPNGCGKSTLLRTILNLQPHDRGEVLLDGDAVENLSPGEIARRAAYLPQARPAPNITARRMALHGRFPYLSWPRRYRREDYAAADRALEQAGAGELADRLVPSLSGGQRQKVYFAMALAQDTPAILMDEPTTFLDIRHQIEVMRAARKLAEAGKTVVMVLHDLALALRTADRGVVLLDGAVLAAGTPGELLASGALDTAFGVHVLRAETPGGTRYYYE